MPLTWGEYAIERASSRTRFNASSVEMSGFGAPFRTAMPMLDSARSTRLEATTRPSAINWSRDSRASSTTSTGSPRRTRLTIDAGPVPAEVASVTTVCPVARWNIGTSARCAAAVPPALITRSSSAKAGTANKVATQSISTTSHPGWRCLGAGTATSVGSAAQPGEDGWRGGVGWEHRIDDVRDAIALEDQTEPLEQRPLLIAERRQSKGVRELELLIAEHWKRQVEPRRHLQLIRRRLRAEAKDGGSEALELGVVIAERAVLRRAATSAGDLVPSRRGYLVGRASSRVGIDHGPASRLRRDTERASGRGRQRQIRSGQPGQMLARSVIGRNGEVGRGAVQVVRAHEPPGCPVDRSRNGRSILAER